MSEYESPEQRQIRELRNQIYSLNSQNSRQSSENNYLRQQIENIRRQQSVENELRATGDEVDEKSPAWGQFPCELNEFLTKQFPIKRENL